MTYRIHAELGKRTDTMFADGKILEKTTFSHLEKRPQRFNSLLHSIQSSHQKEAFKYLQVILHGLFDILQLKYKSDLVLQEYIISDIHRSACKVKKHMR